MELQPKEDLALVKGATVMTSAAGLPSLTRLSCTSLRGRRSNDRWSVPLQSPALSLKALISSTCSVSVLYCNICANTPSLFIV
jgi:hypothetical protein